MTLRRLMRRPSFFVSLAALVLIGALWAITASATARPQTLDTRTYDVASQIQCPVCNGESVADSNSALAMQMRAVIRSRLAAGQSEQQVLAYFEQQYGDTILESPPKQGFTTLIWVAPVLMFVAGAGLVFAVGREWRASLAATGETARAGEGDDALDATELTRDEADHFRALLRRELEAEEGLPMRHGTEGA